MIGIGLIGCGGMGGWHADNLAGQQDCSVVAVADAVAPSAEVVATRVGARVLDAMALIADPAVDAVLIASSDDTHAEFAAATVAAGKPCLLEKPLGETMAQADQILDAEVAAGRRLIRVGFMRELDPAHADIAAAIERLGPITKLRSVHRNRAAFAASPELLLAQALIHDIHTIRWLSGEELATVRVHSVDRPDGFHDVTIVGTLTSGALAIMEFEEQAFAYEVYVEATGEAGMVATVAHPRVFERRAGLQSMAVGPDWFVRFDDAYRLEIADWISMLGEGVFRGPTVWDGYAAQVVVEAGRRSIAEQAEVAVELPPRPDIYR